MNNNAVANLSSLNCFARIFACILLWAANNQMAAAEASITADLGTAERVSLNTLVTQNGAVYDISQGTQKGSIVFHGFEQFGLKAGETATFDTGSAVKNIVARVTGGGSSIIEGTLKSTAGLWLMNPNGIVIGDGAQLNINGDLALLTADHILFDENNKFSALQEGLPENLSVDAPTGFGFIGKNLNKNPDVDLTGNIVINQTGTPDLRSIGNISEEKENHNLLIAGREISMRSGKIERRNGRLIVAAVNDTKDVNLPAWNLSSLRPINIYNKFNHHFDLADQNDTTRNLVGDYRQFGDIRIDQFELGDLYFKKSTDSIFVAGKSVNFSAYLAVKIYAPTIFEAYGDEINLGGSLNGANANGKAGIFLRAHATNSLIGKFRYFHSAVDTHAPDVLLSTSGVLQLNNSNIEIRSTSSPLQNEGYILIAADNALGSNRSGTPSITLNESHIGIYNTLTILQNVVVAGKIQFITDGDISIIGGFGNSSPAVEVGVVKAVYGTNNSGRDVGSIDIAARDLLLSKSPMTDVGAKLIADRSWSSANGGNIILDLTGNLIISGDNSGLFTRSGVFDSKDEVPISQSTTGESAGRINVNASSITLNNSAAISSEGYGKGVAGNLNLDSQIISLNDLSSITSSTYAEGAAGDIDLQAGILQLNDRAKISATSTKSGNAGKAGNINISADDVLISANQDRSSSLLTNGASNDNLKMPAGIFSSSAGNSSPGNINISAYGRIVLDAGNIDVSAKGSSANSDGKGSITLNSPNIQLKNGALITSESTSTADAGDITLNAQNRIQLSDSQITTNAPNANGGNIAIQNGNATTNSRLLQLSKSTISASAGTNGGNITIAADTIINIDSTVKATGERGTNGDVVFTSPQLDVSTLITDLSVPVLDASRLLQQACSAASARKASSFVVNKKPLNQAPGGYRLSRLNNAALPVADTKNSLPAKALKLPGNSIDCQSIAGI